MFWHLHQCGGRQVTGKGEAVAGLSNHDCSSQHTLLKRPLQLLYPLEIRKLEPPKAPPLNMCLHSVEMNRPLLLLRLRDALLVVQPSEPMRRGRSGIKSCKARTNCEPSVDHDWSMGGRCWRVEFLCHC